MRLRIAKIDQQPIPEILRNVAAVALDHLRAGGLIGADDLPQVFRIKLTGERGGVHEVAEHDGELAAFGLWRGGCGRGRSWLEQGNLRDGRRECRCWLGGRWQRRDRPVSAPRPDQHSPLLVYG